MRTSRNRPRSRHKVATWEAEQQRRERCGLSTDLQSFSVVSRSLSLRAAALKEAAPGHSESARVKRRTGRAVRAEIAILLSGDSELRSILSRS